MKRKGVEGGEEEGGREQKGGDGRREAKMNQAAVNFSRTMLVQLTSSPALVTRSHPPWEEDKIYV